jgi:PAS domain S-box-containing protein
MLNKFKSLSIRLKLLCGFGVVGGMLLLIGGFAVFGMNRLNAGTESIYKVNLLPVTVLSDLRAAMLKRSNVVVWHILAHDGPTMAAREQSIKDLDSEIEQLLAKYAPIIITESEQKTFDRFKAGMPPYLEVRGKVLQLSKNFSKDAAAEAQKTELIEKLGVLYGALDALIEENKKQAQDSYTSSQELGLFFNWTMGLVSICALLLGAFVLWYVSKLISESVGNVLEAAHQFQAGNLAYRATVTIQDETGQLAQAFNQMGEQIEANVKESVEWKYTMAAVSKAQAVIEFGMDGTILTANENFLQTLGYRLEEIKGQHHRLFADAAYASSGEYAAFWQKLNRGEYDAGVYRRIGKGGKEVWIQASYNPILDVNGKPYKVVKFATDITGQKKAQNEVEKLIAAAALGQLSERIKTDEFTGAPKELTNSFNRLLESVSTPLHEAQAVLTALAANDLTKRMAGSYQGEFDQMKASLNSALHNLVGTIAAVRETVESVTTSAEHINDGNMNLSQRTSEQASSLEETSASMEEMTATVKQNADNAKQANQLAGSAREIADKGGTVTLRAVEAMNEINKSSKKIADIITVIDEIAFQTNLLALNAAVEAARAGEHGRGFAVVAAEVRNLAQRSATAAKEIKGLINESIQRVTDGSDLVNQSGKTLEEIVNAVKRVSDIIAEITAASQEQASGIDQVNKAIMVVDETTQQNAALVEETTSASQSMKSQADELLRRMSKFKVQMSEEDKVTCLPVVSVREHTARAIDRAYNLQERQPAEPRKPGAKPKTAPKKAMAAAGDKNHSEIEDFEEF